MLFRRSVVGAAALAAWLAACSDTPLPQAVSPDPADPETPTVAAPYRPVMAGTAAYAPVGLKSWRELNDGVAPGGGRSP